MNEEERMNDLFAKIKRIYIYLIRSGADDMELLES